MKTLSLVGARPQFVKEAIFNLAVREANAWQHVLVHSGQHYDINMSDVFFQELEIPKPDYFMGIGSGTHGAMTAAALTAMEDILIQEKPDQLIVYGDTNTTLAGCLAAVKLGIPVAHIEAGLRQTPTTMPEEINRRMVDSVASSYFCTSALAVENLRKEGKVEHVYDVGDVMYDLYLRMENKFQSSEYLEKYNLCSGDFVVVTMHRDFNVDTPETLTEILKGLVAVRETLGKEILFFMHPRTKACINRFELMPLLAGITVHDPIGYIELMSLVQASFAVVTDSGGLQKEAYFAGKRSLVVMPDTCWKELLDCNWNFLIAPDATDFLEKAQLLAEKQEYPKSIYGKGDACKSIVAYLQK